MNTPQPRRNKLAELLAAAKATVQSTQSTQSTQDSFIYNQEQQKFIDTVVSGESCVLIGAAGTGKTTSTKGAIQQLLQSKYIPTIAYQHKHLPLNTPGIVAVSYTRRAVMNLRKALPQELKDNCITIHKLLEYQPTFYTVIDEDGEEKQTMKFEPNRHRGNPLPPTIKTIIIDEGSMVSVDLFHQIWLALPDPMSVQFIFLGDIQQLPPVFGSAILGFQMLKKPVVELTRVYRQALESPIIRLAHRILSGETIPASEFQSLEVPGELKLHPWKKKISSDNALLTIAAFFRKAFDAGQYNPDTDMILIPFNKACGTDELNKHIATHLATFNNSVVHEVIAGFNKHYFRVGEKILYEKEDAVITNIERNPTYTGKYPQPASTALNYWGTLSESDSESLTTILDSPSDEDIDLMLESLANAEVSERVREASHIITIRLTNSDEEVTIKTAAEINSLVMAYALTIHKSQGSEWRKVFLMLHHSHNTMLQRELLYTACTRARKELYVICEPDAFEKGISGQRIKGDTLQEKAEFFKGKLESGEESFLHEMLT